MQVVLRRGDADSTSDVTVVATYEESSTIEPETYTQPVQVVHSVPASKVTIKLVPGGPPEVTLDGQWLSQTRAAGRLNVT